MREILEYELCRIGYKKLSAATSGFQVYFTQEAGYVNAVLLVDLLRNPAITAEKCREFQKKTVWRFTDGGSAEIHMLTIFLAEEAAQAKRLSAGDRFEWIIPVNEKRLLIEEGQAEDFYGLKKHILSCVDGRVQVDPAHLAPLEYDPKGQPYVRSVLQRPLVNHGIFILNLLLFTGCILSGNILYDRGMLSYQQVLAGEYYRIFTSMFLHADMSHILGNMLILYYLGEIVERALGHIRYLILYLLSGIAAAFLSMWVSYLTRQDVSSLGASGAIFGMVGALLWITIRNRGYAEIMSVRKVLFLIGYSLYSGFISTNVDNAAHVGGLIGGFLLAVILYHKKSKDRTRG